MELNTLSIILIVAILVLFVILRFVYGFVGARIAARKGWKGGFWLCFFLGLFGILIIESRPPRTFIMNPQLQQNLMYVTWLYQWGALTEAEFKREKKVLYWMNHYLS